MNLLLFSAAELREDSTLRLSTGRRHRHLREVLKVSEGDTLRVGQIDGRVGTGRVLQTDTTSTTLHVALQNSPPPPLDLTLVLALPRPKMLRRILRSSAELGVKEIHLIHSYRVEKSYWQSPQLKDPALREYLLAGLEQVGDTIVPAVEQHPRFRPFAEDTLPDLIPGRAALLAEPKATESMPATPSVPALLVLGPEGGFIPFEVGLLTEAGCQPVTLGARILRVETALLSLLGRYAQYP